MVVVRIANRPEEIGEALSVRHRVFVDEQQVPPSLETDDWDSDPDVVHLIALEEDTAIGTARVRFLSETTAKLERLAVLSTHRRQGIGQRLMEQAEQVATERGKKEMVLNAQVQALPFYHRLGYREVGDPFDDAGILHQFMSKLLRHD
jgi:predicted GNAT family N-acyltransferase